MINNQTICLNMIVKNESAIIEETLANILDNMPIDYWVISDTGSTDDTTDRITSFFKHRNIPGEIYHDEWKNFGHNRNIALNHCRNKSDYVFFFDADDRFYGTFHHPSVLNKDIYLFNMQVDNTHTQYLKALLIKNHPDLFWKGIIHEFIDFDETKHTVRHLNSGDYFVNSGKFGARSQVSNKAERDAQVLVEAFNNPDDDNLKPRYAFYAGMAFQRAKQFDKAIEWFQKRLALHGDDSDLFNVYCQLGHLYQQSNQPQLALDMYLTGFQKFPNRFENAYYALTLLKQFNAIDKAHTLMTQIDFERSSQSMYVGNVHIKNHLLPYEITLVSYAAKDFPRALKHSYQLLKSKSTPLEIRQTVITNLLNFQQHFDASTHSLLKKIVKSLNNPLNKKIDGTHALQEALIKQFKHKKILFLQPYLMVGGVETVLKSYLSLLASHDDYEVELLFADYTDPRLCDTLPKNVKITTLLTEIESQFLSLSHSKLFDETLSASDKEYYRTWYFGIRHTLNQRLLTYINDNHIDLLIDFKNTLFSHFIDSVSQINIPILYWIHSHSYFKRFAEYTDAYRTIFSNVAAVISICNDMAQVTQKQFSQLKLGNTNLQHYTLYNPIETDTILKNATLPVAQEELSLLNQPFIVNVARLFEPQKNHLELIRIYKALKQRGITEKLYIIGDGPSKEMVQEYIHQLDLSNDCLLLGTKTNPYPFIQKAKLFVHTANYEGLPTVLIESMACQTPVVVYDCPTGPREILDNGQYGKLIPLHDSETFINEVDALLNNTNDRHQLARTAEKSIYRFEKTQILPQLMTIIDTTLLFDYQNNEI